MISLSLFTFTHWRRKWQPTPVFLPGESQGRGSLVGCRLWGRTESDTTEASAAAAAKFIPFVDYYFFVGVQGGMGAREVRVREVRNKDVEGLGR